jgi:hypothetical protein
MIKMANNQNDEKEGLNENNGLKSEGISAKRFEKDVRNGMIISTFAGISWLSFIIIHTFLWSVSFTFFQNTIIGIFSFLAVSILVMSMWMSGASKYGDKMSTFCEI